MGYSNVQDGSGTSIQYVHETVAPIVTTTLNIGLPRGIHTVTDGTIVARIGNMQTDVTLNIYAGKDNFYAIREIKAGGTVPFSSDLQMFW